jgi:hypothetical protein
MNNLNNVSTITLLEQRETEESINLLNSAIVENLYQQTENVNLLPTNDLTGDFNLINQINSDPLNFNWINRILNNVNNDLITGDFFEGLALSEGQFEQISLLLTQTSQNSPAPALTIISLVSGFGLISTDNAIQMAIESLLSVSQIYLEVPQHVESLVINQIEASNQEILDQTTENLNQIDDQFIINNDQVSNSGMAREIINRIYTNRRAILSTGIGLLSLGLNYGSIFGPNFNNLLNNTPNLFGASQNASPPLPLSLNPDTVRSQDLREILNSIYDFIQNLF